LSKGKDEWTFLEGVPEEVACKVTLSPEIAWRVFTKEIDQSSAREQVEIAGDHELAAGILSLTAIIG